MSVRWSWHHRETKAAPEAEFSGRRILWGGRSFLGRAKFHLSRKPGSRWKVFQPRMDTDQHGWNGDVYEPRKTRNTRNEIAIFWGRAKFHLSRKPRSRPMGLVFNHGWTRIITDGMGMLLNHERHETHETKSRVFWEGKVPPEPQTWIAMDVFSTTDEHGSPRMEWDGDFFRVGEVLSESQNQVGGLAGAAPSRAMPSRAMLVPQNAIPKIAPG